MQIDVLTPNGDPETFTTFQALINVKCCETNDVEAYYDLAKNCLEATEVGELVKCTSFTCLILRFAGLVILWENSDIFLYFHMYVYDLFVEFCKDINFKILPRSSKIYLLLHSVYYISHTFSVLWLFIYMLIESKQIFAGYRKCTLFLLTSHSLNKIHLGKKIILLKTYFLNPIFKLFLTNLSSILNFY